MQFTRSPKEKSKGVKSGDLVGHETGPLWSFCFFRVAFIRNIDA